ncbi:hypothetical protein EG327_007290 [Venturia inaequalis]|uniref:Uncharacterized protein n=1 Tax=Venturia inaequalis TaxID=5025 RepID=A0A8H3YYP1_VENIN|nr:hypothetical protein EG327_007290 [Venturia inaequalis]
MPPKKVKPTRRISTSAHLDVLYKPPRGKISNLGLIQAWITRKALIEVHPVAIELYGEGGAAYGSLLTSIQHVIKTELEQEAKPPKAHSVIDNEAPRTIFIPRPWQTQSRDDKLKAMAIITRECPALHKCAGDWLAELLFRMKIMYVRGNVDRTPRNASFTSASIASSSPAFETLPDRQHPLHSSQIEHVDMTDVNAEDTEQDNDESPENTEDDEEMDDEDSQDEAEEDGSTLPNLPHSQTVAVSHPSSLIPETPVSAPKAAPKRKLPSQTETPSVVGEGPPPKRTKKSTAKATETAENLAIAAKRLAEEKEAAKERQRKDDMKAAALVRLQGRTFVGLVGPEALECAPHEELVVATAKAFREAIMVLGKLRTCFITFKKDKDE